MLPVFTSRLRPLKSVLLRSVIVLSALALLLEAGALRADNVGTGPNLIPGDFETGIQSFNPWAGVDEAGYLHVWMGNQLAVDDNGKVENSAFSPSIAVGDLNGDGLPDLVVADARGFFWFYPNSGKPNAPVFTQGELMPIWLGEDWLFGDVVPRIQLIDYTGENKLSIVAGTYAGHLYFIHNNGSATSPDFRMPTDRTALEIPTHTEGLLWCNYLAPFLYDWGGTGRLDLLMGEGTYSANSMYLFTNQGDNARPLFKEQQRIKIIPGMGREHLTPQVVDWNNDGKPDVIAGERTGYINVYLNQNTDNSYPPTFDKDHPIHVMFGTADKVGSFPTVCVADLNHDKLFDLVLGSSSGRLLYSLNTGTPGSPKFDTPVPFKGTYPYAKVTLPINWEIYRDWPFGAPGELLECTNSKIDPNFTPPNVPGFKGQGALKFSVGLPPAKYFKDQYFPQPDTRGLIFATKRTIEYTTPFTLQTDARYIISFLVRCEGSISDFTWRIHSIQPSPTAAAADTFTDGQDFDTPSSWTRVSQTIVIKSLTNNRNPPDMSAGTIQLSWNGDGTIYFDDFSIRKQ